MTSRPQDKQSQYRSSYCPTATRKCPVGSVRTSPCVSPPGSQTKRPLMPCERRLRAQLDQCSIWPAHRGAFGIVIRQHAINFSNNRTNFPVCRRNNPPYPLINWCLSRSCCCLSPKLCAPLLIFPQPLL